MQQGEGKAIAQTEPMASAVAAKAQKAEPNKKQPRGMTVVTLIGL